MLNFGKVDDYDMIALITLSKEVGQKNVHTCL